MLILDPPWPVITPIGDAEALVFYPGTIDAPARFLCSVNATSEYWEFTQYDVRRMTCITEGRVWATPFSKESWERFRPMREAAKPRAPVSMADILRKASIGVDKS